jgi:outer membrane protein assembly factor BamA
MNASLGNAANIGFAYWHNQLFLDNDNMFFSPHRYINADWDVTIRYRKKQILNSSFYLGLNANYKEYGNNSFRNSKGIEYFFADSSAYLGFNFGFNLTGNWNLELGMNSNFHKFDFPSLKDTIMDDEYVFDRGFYKHFESYPLTFALLYNSLDEPYSATRGNKFSVSYSYVPVSFYNSTKDHNYHIVESRLVNYSLLGNRSYAMTIAESNANRERLKNMSFAEAIEMLNPINIKEEILDRRVFITQLKARYMIEENKGKAPFTAMGKLGGNFPLRAYSDGYFTGAIVAGISNEYRWPIDRYADMLIFNEYGIYSDDFGHLSSFNLRNSYGFGFRVRTPKLFISRFALAFHGLQGISVILTTKPEYD